ncbi:MAG: Prevent host death protein Phd antitoxin [Burkholderia sp.]|nr:Prevent host death protein Phd antitoxin [Burkholderia sp.]
MRTINVDQAKSQLFELIEAVGRGEEIVIAKGGKPVARLVPIQSMKMERTPGALRGKIYIAEDFDAPLANTRQAGYDGD